VESQKALQQLAARARRRLVPRDGGDTWLWDHTCRVVRTADRLRICPELAAQPPDATALHAACLYREAGWAIQWQEGRIQSAQLLARPTQDLQLELAAEALLDDAGGLLDSLTLDRAAEAIRQSGRREPTLPEAIVLSDACNLQAVGLIELLRQFRQYQATGQPLDRLIETARRKQEYRYWDAWIRDCLRLELSRELALQRVAALEGTLEALRQHLTAEDLADLLSRRGLEVPDPPELL